MCVIVLIKFLHYFVTHYNYINFDRPQLNIAPHNVGDLIYNSHTLRIILYGGLIKCTRVMAKLFDLTDVLMSQCSCIKIHLVFYTYKKCIKSLQRYDFKVA